MEKIWGDTPSATLIKAMFSVLLYIFIFRNVMLIQ